MDAASPSPRGLMLASPRSAARRPLASPDWRRELLSPSRTETQGHQGVLARALPDQIPSGATNSGTASLVLRAIIFGAINGIVLVPVMVGFAQIIFRDPFFSPHRPLLIKLVLFSSIVHQIVFTLASSLPFAIGQVQDAGLIFLSAIASACVDAVGSGDDSTVISTTLVTLSLATALLGVALVLTGVFKLASLVQYLPQPVVSGYLAYIGLFCFQAGMAMMTTLTIENVAQWPKVLDWTSMRLLLPGVIIGLLLFLILRRFHHFAVLPTLLLAIPIGFFVVLLICQVSLQEARELGWVDSDTSTVQFWHMWQLFDFKKVQWSTMGRHIPTWLGMYFVVAFSSCLDVAAIQLDLGKKLDFNHELKTVGISNFVSGVTGGYTGSYIFSQTIFTMRSGIQSRLIGVVLIVCEVAIFMLPVSILAYVPRLFFGAILTFIAVDLVMEHLFESFQKMNFSAYLLVWASFLAINVTGLEVGMLIGVGLTALQFVLGYARFGHAARRVPSRSRVMRGFAQRQLLEKRMQEVVALEITGFIFFGSALKLLEDIKNRVYVAGEGSDASGEPMVMSLAEMPSDSKTPARDAADDVCSPKAKTSFLVLDFARVSGMDITAVGTCFKSLKQLLQQHGIGLVFAAVDTRTIQLLQHQGVLPLDTGDGETGMSPEVSVFESLDSGLEWCEESLLQQEGEMFGEAARNSTGIARAGSGFVRLLSSGGLRSSGTDSTPKSQQALEDDGLLALEEYFLRIDIAAGGVIFSVGDGADAMYVIEAGEVVLTTKAGKRLQRYSHGGIFGELDFFLHRPRTFCATAATDCVLWQLPQSNLSRIGAEHPARLNTLHNAMLRGLCLSASSLLEDVLADDVHS